MLFALVFCLVLFVVMVCFVGFLFCFVFYSVIILISLFHFVSF